MRFNEQVALVTGSASGIGLGCVRALLRKGCRVVMNDLSEEKLDCAKKQVVEDDFFPESSVMTVSADVTDSGAVEDMVSQIAQKWRPVTSLVNNAGISGGRKTLGEITEEEWDCMIVANLRGVYACTRTALPAMYQNQWGRIVNIASIAGVSGKLMASAHYAAAKGGIAAFTKRVAIEAASHNVAVNCVAPGLTADTGFTRNIKGDLLGRYLAQIPTKRAATCEELGALVAFLCSRHAGYIIGQTILIDGGAST